MKQPYKISVINFFVGIVLALFSSAYLLFKGVASYYISRITNFSFLAFLIFVIVCAIYYLIKLWRVDKYDSLLSILLVIPIILVACLVNAYFLNFSETKVRVLENSKYNEIVQTVMKMDLPGRYHKEYKLSHEYWGLTPEGKIIIDKEKDLINITFPVREGILSGTFYVYSNSIKTIYDKYDWYRVEKKKPHWFLVVEK